MKIQVLYFEGCPNYKPAVDLIRSVVANATIEEIEIRTTKDAKRMRFLGSPTILVDGVDVEPGARTRTDFGFSCRTYSGKGLPSRELVASSIVRDASPLQHRLERSGIRLAASSIAVAAIASACCWLPLALIALGTSTFGLSARLETLRPWLFATSAILLFSGFYRAYRTQSCCAAKSSRTMVWIATIGVLAFALFPRYADVFMGAVAGPACCKSPHAETAAVDAGQASSFASEESKAAPSKKKPATLTVLSDDCHELKDAFNEDRAAVKAMLIVSPFCPMCRQGAGIVQEQSLAKIDSDKLKVYVVWIRRLALDSRQQAEKAMELVPDHRARHFWDSSGQLGKQYGKILDLPRKKDFAWDVYFVFDAQSKWLDVPPTPSFWMHQLGGPETGNILEGGKFREEIFRRLP